MGRAGDDRHQAVKVAALGQDVEHFLGQGHALGGALDVDQSRLTGDGDGFLDVAELDLDFQVEGLFRHQRHVVADDGLETLQGEDHLVGTGGKVDQPERAVFIGDRVRLADQLGAGGFDVDAGNQ